MSGKWVNEKHPKNLQEYIIKKYFEINEDKGRLAQIAKLTDKLAVRDYVAERIGDYTLTQLYGVWDKPEDIDFGSLPVPCVIKTNNGCATNCIIKNKEELNREVIMSKLRRWIDFPYGILSGQPHYSMIEPKILAEEFLIQKPGSDSLPYDYKFFCFNGKPEFILFYCGRKPNSHVFMNAVYDTQWNIIESVTNSKVEERVEKPLNFDRMLEYAGILSQDFEFVRIDFYNINGRIILGEMTFTPDVYINFTRDFLKKWKNPNG